ncbi:MAG TPA: hypothetical protein DIT25_03940 [Candidatus Moranbacteria bacterium]|nr:hypothetical protein [Candidatus Moranbacteria bacterium]
MGERLHENPIFHSSDELVKLYRSSIAELDEETEQFFKELTEILEIEEGLEITSEHVKEILEDEISGFMTSFARRLWHLDKNAPLTRPISKDGHFVDHDFIEGLLPRIEIQSSPNKDNILDLICNEMSNQLSSKGWERPWGKAFFRDGEIFLEIRGFPEMPNIKDFIFNDMQEGKL